ncbi:hypothetical protein [Pedobacter psychroterrae]|uniref:Phospholipase D-like protein n=1 Tax=Pedobacter psychroterrae TaxID=2530453 RepID=A0A4R0NMN1_9SPHI|nr:hypothetical protein [Pedobacter psychroterrae]TCD00514.1 hypothetical protein EZ437_14940 [Pedobacter psychroterrae]
MNKDLILKITFGISLFCGLIGLYLKMMHISFPLPFIGVSVVASIIYSVLALTEIFTAKRIKQPEQVMWVLGFLFFNPITGFIYFVLRRKYIIRTPKLLSYQPAHENFS